MNLVKLLLLISLSTLITGQLIRLPLIQTGAITLTDIFVFLTVALFFMNSLFIRRSLMIPPVIFNPFILFTLSALASTIIAINFFTPIQIIVSSFFLIRFVCYFLLSVVVFNVIKKNEIIRWIQTMLTIGVVFSIIGILQLIFFPDLSALQLYGWDPHQTRLVSTTLDPNFSGGILAIMAAFSLSLYLFHNKKTYFLMLCIFVFALLLTFSRSSYLALSAVIASAATFKNARVLYFSSVIFILAFTLIPTMRQRIIGALTIDETASARIESWQKALVITKQNILFGVGFNTYRYAQSNYGYFSYDDPSGGHSGAGSDSSILLVAATTGLIGLSLFLLFLMALGRIFSNRAKLDPLKLGTISTFAAIIIHSQFVNSLFYPQIMLMFYFILGLALVSDA